MTTTAWVRRRIAFPIWESMLVPKLGFCYIVFMQVIARRTLKAFWERFPEAETPLKTWYAMADKAEWKTPADIKAQFGTTVDFVGDNRAVFDIGGNKFRLIVRFSYTYRMALIKFIGTHAEYDRIDAETV